MLPQVLACMGSQPIGKPSPMVFSNASGGAHVACYRKVQEGFLYPLAEGLLFFKPPMLLKLHEIASMSTTAGGARFLELSVEMEDGTIALPPSSMFVQLLGGMTRLHTNKLDGKRKNERWRLCAHGWAQSSVSSTQQRGMIYDI